MESSAKRIRPRGRAAILLAMAWTLGACSTSPTLAPPSIGDETPLPTISNEAIQAAREFRESFGLRADTAWILDVAASATADRTTFGVPLTPDELEELKRRARSVDQIRETVVEYGARHADAWAGAFIDQERGGILVVQFSRAVDVHATALRSTMWPGAEVEFREVRNSLIELDSTAGRIHLDDPWFGTIPAVALFVGPNVVTNRVDLEISSANPNAESLIWEHYRLTSDQLLIQSDGNGALLLERGQLRVVVTDTGGRPISGLGCAAFPDADGAYDPRPVPMPTTDACGVCLLTLPATGYWIRLERGAGPPTPVAMARAVVVAGTTTEVTVVVP